MTHLIKSLFFAVFYLCLGLARPVLAGPPHRPSTYAELLASEEQKKLIADNDVLIQQLQKKWLRGDIVGMELIVADQSDNRIESNFGHLLLRFVDRDASPGDDISLSFVADIHTPRQSNLGGVVGSYAVFPQLRPFRLFVKQYLKDDDRPIHRYIIPTSEDMRKAAVATLIEWWDEYKQVRQAILMDEINEARASASNWSRDIFERESDVVGVSYQGDFLGWGVIRRESSDAEHAGDSLLNQQALAQSAARLHMNVSNDYQLRKKTYVILPFSGSVQAVEVNDQTLVIPAESFSQFRQQNALEEYLANTALQWPQRPDDSHPLIFPTLNKWGVRNGFVVFYLKPQEQFHERYQVLKVAAVEPKIEVISPLRVTTPSLGRYTFFSNNCAGALLNFLKQSNFPSQEVRALEGRIPVLVPDYLKRILLNPYPKQTLDSLYQLKLKMVKMLKLKKGIDQLNKIEWNIENFADLATQLTPKELMLFMDGFPRASMELKLHLMNTYQLQSLNYTFQDLYPMGGLSLNLYQTCRDKSCSDALWEELKKQWSNEELKASLKQSRSMIMDHKLPEELRARPELILHYELLLLESAALPEEIW